MIFPSPRRFIILQAALFSLSGLVAFCVAAPSKVILDKREEMFQLTLNGQPFPVKGAGADAPAHLAALAAAGGNTVRTWASKDLGKVLAEAQKHGLHVCAGLWMGHQRHGFDYQDANAVRQQLEEKLSHVRKHKDHPALLMWSVGNEAEGEGSDPSVWLAINQVAREIKRIDPNHPIMTVTAELGANASKVRNIERFCPAIDIIGVNAYGGIESVGKRFREAKGSKPYIITEHGPLGPWESGKTSWGAPEEWSSTEKARLYAKGYRANAIDHAGLCLGTYAFLWGHKQETTATWFGMLLPDGSRLGAVDAMTELWTGAPPKNRCPTIEKLTVNRASKLIPGETIHATLIASDPEGGNLTYKWVLLSDSGTIGSGGDPQEAETTIQNAVIAKGNKATATVPASGGGYRLFAYVYDGQGGAAVGNVPFRVNAPIKLEKEMPVAKLPYTVYAENVNESVFVPSGYMGNASAVSMLESPDDPRSGKTCLKAEYKSASSWGGVLWQSPAQDWDGQKPGGANLTGAARLEFWARGAQGGEVVNFVFGVLDGNQPYRDTAKGELNNVKLTTKWQKWSIPLRDKDLRQIKTGFGWSLAGQGKPVTFYLDDIRFVGEE